MTSSNVSSLEALLSAASATSGGGGHHHHHHHSSEPGVVQSSTALALPSHSTLVGGSVVSNVSAPCSASNSLPKSPLKYSTSMTREEVLASLQGQTVLEKCNEEPWVGQLKEYFETCSTVSLASIEFIVKQILLWGFGRTTGEFVLAYDSVKKTFTEQESLKSLFTACLPPPTGSVTFGEVRRAVQKMYDIPLKKIHKAFRELVSECFQAFLDMGLFATTNQGGPPKELPIGDPQPLDIASSAVEESLLNTTQLEIIDSQITESQSSTQPDEQHDSSNHPTNTNLYQLINATKLGDNALPSVPKIKSKSKPANIINDPTSNNTPPKQPPAAPAPLDKFKGVTPQSTSTTTQSSPDMDSKKKRRRQPSADISENLGEPNNNVRQSKCTNNSNQSVTQAILSESEVTRRADRRYERVFDYASIGTKTIFYSLSRNAWIVIGESHADKSSTDVAIFHNSDSSHGKAKEQAEKYTPVNLLKSLKRTATSSAGTVKSTRPVRANQQDSQTGSASGSAANSNVGSITNVTATSGVSHHSVRNYEVSDYNKWAGDTKYPNTIVEKSKKLVTTPRCWCHAYSDENNDKQKQRGPKKSKKYEYLSFEEVAFRALEHDSEAFMFERLSHSTRDLNTELEFQESYRCLPWQRESINASIINFVDPPKAEESGAAPPINNSQVPCYSRQTNLFSPDGRFAGDHHSSPNNDDSQIDLVLNEMSKDELITYIKSSKTPNALSKLCSTSLCSIL